MKSSVASHCVRSACSAVCVLATPITSLLSLHSAQAANTYTFTPNGLANTAANTAVAIGMTGSTRTLHGTAHVKS
ncbi:MAG: hypothetical protein WCP35_22255 [Verrucomicrobiota bacterium]